MTPPGAVPPTDSVRASTQSTVPRAGPQQGPQAGSEALPTAQTVERSTFRFTTTRPVAVLMVFCAIIVFGAFSIRLLPLNLMPDISYPKLTVRTEYPGAAPAEVENNVSRPLEEILGVVTGLTRIESVSRAGYSDVTLEFAWDTDMDEANQDVLEKLDTVEPVLPDDVENPLILRYDPTLDPVLTLSLGGEGTTFEGPGGLKLLRRIADRDVRRLLEPIEGVAAVKVKGGLEEEIEVDLDEGQLRRTGIGIETVISRLSAENINLAGGTMRDGRTRYLVRTVNEFRDLSDIGSIVVVRREERDVRLQDIAQVRFGYKDREVITRVDGSEAVEIEVYKEAEANIVDMADRVRERIAQRVDELLDKQYSAHIAVASDRSRFIESSIAEVRNTAIFGGILAVLVLFFFLRDVRSTLIVAVSIPVSVMMTFAPLNIVGVSLNIMSLGGLALGIGMLVDNSIVVLESIHRCRQEGDTVVAATIRGTSEVGAAVVAATLTSIAVFFPMVFVEGVAGQMFGDLGLTVVFSLVASLAVALFLIPMLASRRSLTDVADDAGRSGGVWSGLRSTWVRWGSFADLVASVADVRRRPWTAILLPYTLLRFALHLVFDVVGKVLLTVSVLGLGVVVGAVWAIVKALGLAARPLLAGFGLLLSWVESLYPPVIRWCLRNRVMVYALAIASMGFVVWGGMKLDTELIPELHQGEFTVELTLPVGTPLEGTDRAMAPLEGRVLDETPHLDKVTTTIGSESDAAEIGERGEHTTRIRVTLSQDGESQSVLGRLGLGPDAGRARAERIEAEALAAVRDITDDVPDLNVGVSRPVLFSFKTPIEVEIRGHELGDLSDATNAVAERMRQIPGLRDVHATIRPGSPEIHIRYDRDALARRDLDIRAVAELVRDKVAGNEATKFNRKDRKVPIRVRVDGADRASLEELRRLVINPGQTRPVPLDAVADIEVGRGPNEIRRVGQRRVGVVSANVEGAGLGSLASQTAEALATLPLPDGVSTAITGQSEEWETSSRSLYLALGLSVFLVYVIMASQFESLVYPLLILLTIPLAFVGVVAALWVLGIPMSVVVFLGAIMLAGIVVNNAIVLVDYVGRLKSRGLATEAALELAGRVRLRPILMTTLTTVLGLLPMALGLGDGAEIRTPMAITVIAGLSFSTLLTLVIIPTLYAGVDRLKGPDGDFTAEDALREELASIRPEQLGAEELEAATKAASAQADAPTHEPSEGDH